MRSARSAAFLVVAVCHFAKPLPAPPALFRLRIQQHASLFKLAKPIFDVQKNPLFNVLFGSRLLLCRSLEFCNPVLSCIPNPKGCHWSWTPTVPGVLRKEIDVLESEIADLEAHVRICIFACSRRTSIAAILVCRLASRSSGRCSNACLRAVSRSIQPVPRTGVSPPRRECAGRAPKDDSGSVSVAQERLPRWSNWIALLFQLGLHCERIGLQHGFLREPALS